MNTATLQEIVGSHVHDHLFGALLDPDDYYPGWAKEKVCRASEAGVDFLLVGGSKLAHPSHTRTMFEELESTDYRPIIAFPGADHPECTLPSGASAFLCPVVFGASDAYFWGGWHTQAAGLAERRSLVSIPMGYIVIGGNGQTAVERILGGDRDLRTILARAKASEMLGLRVVYLDAGSGARASVPLEVVRKVRRAIRGTLIVGGGLRSPRQVVEVVEAGADVIVVGNAIQQSQDQELLREMVRKTHEK